ncbi:MAG TPA: hypothetical protein VKF14_04745, partial [Candidatus Dormibacteraeota bacterium]|nr:hypothetical protein [Candidatus Dormibacteraeota bacterium]
REQIIFPEVDYDKIDKLRGLEVSIVTTAKTDAEGRSLLAQLGMPFSRQDARVAAFAVPAKRRSRRPVSRTHKR